MRFSINSLTLRDKVREAIQTTRDLADHIQNSFLPKAENLTRVSSLEALATNSALVSDLTVRNHVAAVLEADQYTDRLDDRGEQLFVGILSEVEEIVGG